MAFSGRRSQSSQGEIVHQAPIAKRWDKNSREAMDMKEILTDPETPQTIRTAQLIELVRLLGSYPASTLKTRLTGRN